MMEGRPESADPWGTGDILGRILAAIDAAGLDPHRLTVEQLAPVDHFHARGFTATRDLADRLPIRAADRIIDIGCGLGGPARYLAQRFGCSVEGVDITPAFVQAARTLTDRTGLSGRVAVQVGDAAHLPFIDRTFDGGYSQHVTMNVADRARFLGEAFRVLKPGAFFALTEHGLGAVGEPHYPVPWSEDGRGSYLLPPEATVAALQTAGFREIDIRHTGPMYLTAYQRANAKAEQGSAPPLGLHLVMGDRMALKLKNAARNIAEQRTHPVEIVCRKPTQPVPL